uniref:hypothetical protein n=1 Tax=Bacillus altitudinis TaxID=293387 RepID=UPI001C92F195
MIEELNGFKMVGKGMGVKKSFGLFLDLMIEGGGCFEIEVVCVCRGYYEIDFPFLPLGIQVVCPKSKRY